MPASTRTDDLTMTARVTVVITDEERDEFEDTWLDEEEYVQEQTENHIKDEYDNPRGSINVGIMECEEFETKTVYDTVVNVN